MLKIIWAVGIFSIFVLSVLPPDQVPITSSFSDKIEHLVAYGLVAFFGFIAASTFQRRVLLGLGMVVMGITLEFVQAEVLGRFFELLDMVANGLGVGIAAVLAAIYLRIKSSR